MAAQPRETDSNPEEVFDQDPPAENFKNYAVAYSSARPQAGTWLNYYFWLEIYCMLFYIVIAGILSFASISYLKPLNITLWYGVQVLFPVSYISTIFFVGPPPQSLKQLQLIRHKVHTVYSVLTGMACIGAGLAFIIVQCVYAASQTCKNDLSSFCQGHLAAFVFLMVMCGVLVIIEVLSIVTVIASWIPKNRMAMTANHKKGSDKANK